MSLKGEISGKWEGRGKSTQLEEQVVGFKVKTIKIL